MTILAILRGATAPAIRAAALVIVLEGGLVAKSATLPDVPPFLLPALLFLSGGRASAIISTFIPLLRECCAEHLRTKLPQGASKGKRRLAAGLQALTLPACPTKGAARECGEPQGLRQSPLPRRLMARLRTLTPSIEVRILAGHPAFPSPPFLQRFQFACRLSPARLGLRHD